MTQPKPSALQQAQQLAYVKYTAPVPDADADADGTPSGEHRANRTIITCESRGLILSAGTTGFRTWEAALHLGSFLSTPAGQALVRGKRVIELGAGTGFLSMFCAKYLGVQSMVATDRELGLIQNIRDCMRRNELDPAIFHPAIWEWGTRLSLTQCEQEDEGDAAVSGSGDLAFDVALGADLVSPHMIIQNHFLGFVAADLCLAFTMHRIYIMQEIVQQTWLMERRSTTSTLSPSCCPPSATSSKTITSENSLSPRRSGTRIPSRRS